MILFLLLLFSPIVLSSGSSWHHVKTTAANKEAFSCDEDLMGLSQGANGICLPPLLLSQYSAREKKGEKEEDCALKMRKKDAAAGAQLLRKEVFSPANHRCPPDRPPAHADSRCSLTLLALLPSPLPSTTDMHTHLQPTIEALFKMGTLLIQPALYQGLGSGHGRLPYKDHSASESYSSQSST
ncbi:hypothetical protein FQN60_003760 [Etheostoma spectabile]|uniref:Uncharacterized protein n=1 Tax=Etheostoma spectabile TaxID=54343 RepID=A0A5J5CWL5_9PERO|nr:hypothetical protein FQN60_003760 [Etheostoma spectabile]